MTVVVGADEAGKGPVLGPMVAAAVRADPAELPPVDDSKRLSADRRETVAGELRRLAEETALAWAVAVVPTAAIDDPETDMNRLTVAAQVAALHPVTRDAPVTVDAGDTDADRFGRRVRRGLTDGAFTDDRITVETGGDTDSSPEPASVRASHGADEERAIVGAASVLAKTVRDRRMAEVDDRYGRPVGSGYPSDETTRTFLREYVRDHGELPACARASWATARDALAAAEQSQLDGF